MRSALRMFLRRPGFSLLAAGTLALGIAAATVVFCFVHGVMLSPLPYSNPARLMLLWEFDRASQHDPGEDLGPVNTIPPADFAELGRQSHSFEKLDALTFGFYAIRQGANPTEVIGGRVTPGFFSTLGVQPLLGRTFSANDPPDVAVLGYGLWQSQYGGDRAVVGRQVVLGDRNYTVLGVLPPEFFFYLRDFALWTPLEIRPNDRQSRPAMGVGLLRSGISAAQAQAEFDGIAARLAAASPDTNRNRGIKILGVRDQYSRFFRQPLGVLLISVAFLVLIGCANVASLLLARAAEREREIAIRTALGATRRQIVRQLLAENLVIAALADAAGIAMALVLLPLARTLLPLQLPVPLPGIENITVGLPVLLFTTVVSVGSVLIFGLAPSVRAASPNPGARASSPRAAQTRFLDGIVVAELGLSVLLLTGAGLTMRSVYGLYRHMGFHADHVLTFRTPVGAKVPPQRLVQFYRSVLEGVSRIQGVHRAAAAYNMPAEGLSGQAPVVAEGGNPDPQQVVKAGANVVSGDFFRTLEIPLLAGRTFTPEDGPDSPEVAVVSAMLARKLFSHVDPIGRRIRTNGRSPERWLTVVGVAGDVRPMLAETPIPMIYRPFTQTPPGAIGFVAGPRLPRPR
ncbi:MAG: ABC transporter permease [Bryobacteraceae bacterium]